MLDTRRRRLLRIASALTVATVLAAGAGQVSAQKPPPKPATLKVSAVVSGFSTTVSYQVTAAASDIVIAGCLLTLPDASTQNGCDTTPNNGSGSKLTKYAITYATPLAGAYLAQVGMQLSTGQILLASTGFTVLPGPATHFSVTGLVPQESICYQGIDCVGWPPADYPHQAVKITALDVNGNVATGYTGTVSFVDPVQGHAPGGLVEQSLTNGVGYVPVRIPDLPPTFLNLGPYAQHCPGGNIALTATDTIDPSIIGCESLAGGSLTVVMAQGFHDTVLAECPTGCHTEPTGTITINTNLLAPTIGIPTITQPLVIDGATLAGNYYTQPVDVPYWVVNGTDITITPQCTQCTTAMTYLVKDVDLTLGGDITLYDNGVTLVSHIGDPITQESILATISTTTTGAEDPTCYSDFFHEFRLAECS